MHLREHEAQKGEEHNEGSHTWKKVNFTLSRDKTEFTTETEQHDIEHLDLVVDDEVND